MIRPCVIAGNWKMHKTAAEAADYIKELSTLTAGVDVRVIVAPPFTALESSARAASGSSIELAAQNVHSEAHGAFTGEVSAGMLLDLGVRIAIVGHSERRHVFGESDAFIRQKVEHVLASRMEVILCIGETLEERRSGRMQEVLRRQLRSGLEGLEVLAMSRVMVAYEPVWAIGTGETASPEQAQEAHAFIRGELEQLFGSTCARSVVIQYGGSVKPSNAGAGRH